eukprot:jgi/Botrbrau1/22712/Bobra.0132s0051.1
MPRVIAVCLKFGKYYPKAQISICHTIPRGGYFDTITAFSDSQTDCFQFRF